ncbi:class I SAM-dependent methyltransferase [Terrimonas pollutisoli]|uniref:class I SAM-dependent methyltransferase n=1 Tax=Terrimonas pollutisoli TaxID=3034147 RepID=UPI0023ED9B09|nr:class I SAM-dependent methyltransferase [Terrimonas sp. H1YJ31]
MDIKNTAPAPFSFSGSVPHHFDQYQGPIFFEPYALEIAKRIEPSSVHLALEIACGTGRVTRHLREVIPAASKLIASDISSDMLAVAKEKLKAVNVDWQIIDAKELPFNDNSIDLVVCCFGYMFVPDKPKAFAEAYRVLRPGGVLLFSTWDQLVHNAASHVHRKTVKKYLEEPLPETYKLPFSMNDDNEIRESLQNAGFTEITIERVDKAAISPTAKEAAYGLSQGGALYNEIVKRNPAWIEEITMTIEKELAEKFGAAPMIAPMRALITEAKK